jgi:hypothetical protein
MERPTSDIYAMRRANGDWFALDDHGDFRVPLFRSNDEAMQARAFNGAMLLFEPVMLDERLLKTLAPVKAVASHFWLVDYPSVDLRHGHRVEYAQLAKLVGD